MLGSVMVHAVWFIMLPAVGLPLPNMMSLHTLQGSVTFLLFNLSASYTAVMTTPASTGLALTGTCLSLAQSPHLHYAVHATMVTITLLPSICTMNQMTSEHTVPIARNRTHQCQQLAPWSGDHYKVACPSHTCDNKLTIN
jgi:hypothetical protein